jgi:ribosomal protein S18 acetylase RimI-like enzyme
MLEATIVTKKDELYQVHGLNLQNLKQNHRAAERDEEGFVSWLYSRELLEQMHELAPSVIVRDGERVVAYALTTVKEASAFHPDLETMFRNLENVQYKGRPLSSHHYYCMGQICVAKGYRGLGIVNMLYRKHQELYAPYYDFILTEISTSNPRSQKAHEKAGFHTIYSYRDAMDEWNVVVWDWGVNS